MLKVSPLFTDGAVLCRGKEIRIFGEAEDGIPVRVELRDDRGQLLAENEAESVKGRFLALLPPQEAGSGLGLTIAQGDECFKALDICVGDVYLASGQSNMEWELQNADEGRELIKSHDNALVRYFNVPRRAYVCGEAEEAFENTRWQKVEPGKAGDMSAVAYFFAMKLWRETGVPVGIVDCYWGGTSVTAWMNRETLESTAEGRRYLEREKERSGGKTLQQFLDEETAWMEELHAWEKKVAEYKEVHPEASGAVINREVGVCPWNPPAGPGSPYRPGGLYETMVARTFPLALKGILWYQGESDAGITERYDVLLISLIDLWRREFRDPGLPFIQVQLPMWIDSNAPGDTYTWPALRQAQARVRDMIRNSGMICLLDQGEWDNLHPTAKRVVGERLCQLALNMIYGRAEEVSPRAAGKRAQGNKIILRFSSPVLVSDGKEPALMETAGADGVFKPARARMEGSEMSLSSDEVPRPVYARYAWTDYAKVNLFGENGLPLEPFVM